MDRRSFLAQGVRGTAALGVLKVAGTVERPLAARVPRPFEHGVASGDPLPDGAVIWTRVTPSPQATPGSGLGRDVPVVWRVARDPGLRDVVALGHTTARRVNDHTVKVDVRGLRSGATYHYGFEALGARSPVGRLRTAPAAGSNPAALTLGLVSCSNFEGGYFAAYRHLARMRDLDFVLHVGDYIYEYAAGGYGPGSAIGRVHTPQHETLTLSDYRARYSAYRMDPDLRALHAAHTWVVTWDDHEIANDNWREGAENHTPDEGDYRARAAAAAQAYQEWLPVRAFPDDPTRLYRRLEFGSLATLHVVDSRQYRDAPAGNYTDPAVEDPDRSILGSAQERWFLDGLAASRATWQLIGNPQMITPVLFPPLPDEAARAVSELTGMPAPVAASGPGYNHDQWDGYRAGRRRVLEHIATRGIDNVVFLTGDMHSSWACDVPLDPETYPASPSVATELVGTSVTSDNLDEMLRVPPRSFSVGVEQAFRSLNRHIKLLEFDSHGFSVVRLTPQRLQMDWHYLSDRTDPLARQEHAHAFEVLAGTNQVRRVGHPAYLPVAPS